MAEEKKDSGQEECREAVEKAMNLLLWKDRTEKELQDRLCHAGYSDQAVAYAMSCAAGYGYIDDLRYAQSYILYHKEKKSKKEMRYRLLGKGIREEVLSQAMEGYEAADETAALSYLLGKRLKGKSLASVEFTEQNKITAYLARKGFSLPAIRRVMQNSE